MTSTQKKQLKEKVIDWTKVVSIIAALSGTGYVGVNSASSEDMQRSLMKVDAVVLYLDAKLIPILQKNIEDLQKENRLLRDRLTKLETKYDMRDERLTTRMMRVFSPSPVKVESKRDKMSLPKILIKREDNLEME